MPQDDAPRPHNEDAGSDNWRETPVIDQSPAIKDFLAKNYEHLLGVGGIIARRESSPDIEAGDLVNGAALQLLINEDSLRFNDEAHLLARFILTMRRMVIDQARRRYAQKRGGERVFLDDIDSLVWILPNPDDRMFLDEALAQLPERERQLITLRYIGGYPADEVAQIMGLSIPSISRIHRDALLLLRKMLQVKKP